MCENENRNRGLYDYIEKYEGDITYRVRVFESHDSEDFKKMNKRFKSRLCMNKYEPKMREMIECLEVCEAECN